MPVVRPVVQALADAVADAEGRPHTEVPDLGPGTVMDQLTVMAYDAGRAGLDPGARPRAAAARAQLSRS